jgi:hypothetical protein
MRPQLIDLCGNCSAELREGKTYQYDSHSEQHFCDAQCFREWAEDGGAEKVIEFYRNLNVEEADT